MRFRPSFISLQFLTATSAFKAYNSPECLSWPSHETWTEDLADTLSETAALHGPFPDGYYKEECEGLGANAYVISSAGHGICMHAHACQHEFCREQYSQDLPAYILEAKEETDIQKALKFCREHNIQVTVKTTGHSYHGASTAKNSLLIWMANFKKDGSITDNYESCDGTFHHAIMSINGGETWNDVIEAVGPEYHVVTGGGRTVSAAGGWLMGSGLSFSGRKYGLGVDNVLEFEIVLADGSLVTANACQNQDLFWALRGGGGGTWGIVTRVLYKLHPVVPITITDWFIGGWENASPESATTTLSTWLKFWIEASSNLDPRFGGFWNSAGIHLIFAGTREEANEAFLNQFQDWYNDVLLPKAGFIPFLFGALSPFEVTSQTSSWYEYRGGKDAYNNPALTDATGTSYKGAENVYARLVPLETLQEDPQGLHDLLFDLASNLQLGETNYILGGVISDVGDDATSVHPALRRAAWNIFTFSPDAYNKILDFLPNEITGACFNHHSPIEPNWRDALWGKQQYAKLLGLKEKFDPDRVFNCWHCIDYQGEENPKVDEDYHPKCPTANATSIEDDADNNEDKSRASSIFHSKELAVFGSVSLFIYTLL